MSGKQALARTPPATCATPSRQMEARAADKPKPDDDPVPPGAGHDPFGPLAFEREQDAHNGRG